MQLLLRTSYISLVLLSAIILLNNCGGSYMSTIKRDRSKGMNGSFEFAKSGIPVNWFFYAEPIKYENCITRIDTVNFTDGKQSLNFYVKEVNSSGYFWKKPGLFQTYKAIIGETYKISFWIKNDGCKFLIRASSEGHGKYDENIILSKENIEEWNFIEYNYTVPSDRDFENIRFELNILSPGSFWIDDIRIVGLNDKSQMTEW